MDKLNQSGWVKTKIDEIRTASQTTTDSENVANMRHYERAYKAVSGSEAPPAVMLYVVCRDNDDTYFLKATNMPMTQTIYENRLTPYYNKPENTSEEATPDERGFGAVLPVMYTGGTAVYQYRNELGVIAEVTADIEAQKQEAIQQKSDLTRPVYKPKLEGRGGQYYRDTELWGQPVMSLFDKHRICTWETHINPTFNGNEDLIGNRQQFRNFLEGLEGQFEKQIVDGKLILIGVYATLSKETPEIYTAPFRFFKERLEFKDFHAICNDVPILTTCGQYNLDDSLTIDIQFVITSDENYVRSRFTETNGTQHYFDWKSGGGNGNFTSCQIENMVPTQFESDIQLCIGRSKLANAYAQVIDNLSDTDKHPQQYKSLERHCYGAYVSASGIRLSLAPLIIPTMKQPKHYMDGNKVRVFCDLKTKRAKKFIHFKDWKERSELYSDQHGKNMIVFAINAMICFLQKAYSDTRKDAWAENKFLEVLDGKKVKAEIKKTKSKSVRGKLAEINFGKTIQTALPEFETLEGDMSIKNTILGQSQNSQGNQAIDTLHMHHRANVWIGTQIKMTERDKPEDLENFRNTFRELRMKAREKNVMCFGSLIHYNGLKQDEIKDMLLREPGMSVMSRDVKNGESVEDFETRCIQHFKDIILFYGQAA